jgi:hypothetical protein
VLPLLEATKDKIYHITLADKRWRHNLEALNGDVFNAPRRKVRASIKKLREVGLTPVFVAQYEISGSCGLRDDYLLEPHVHVIMGGASKSELKAAFKVRLPKAQRGRDKPVRVTRVKHSQLGNLLGYISKMKAQDRVEYRRDDGRHGRTTNRMPPDHELGWLRCMASVSIAHLIQFGGFAVPITSRFTHCEMATLVGEL